MLASSRTGRSRSRSTSRSASTWGPAIPVIPTAAARSIERAAVARSIERAAAVGITGIAGPHVDADRDVERLRERPVRLEASIARLYAFVLRHHLAKYIEQTLCVQCAQLIRRARLEATVGAAAQDAQIAADDDSVR